MATLGTTTLNSAGLVTFTGSIELLPAQAGLADYDFQTLTVRCHLELTVGASDFELATTYAGTGVRTSPSFVPMTLTSYAGSGGTLSLNCQQASANNGGQFLLMSGGRFSWLSGT